MLNHLDKKDFIKDTVFAEICKNSNDNLNNEIDKFDKIGKDLFNNYRKLEKEDIERSFDSLYNTAKIIFTSLKNKSTDQNFLFYIHELKKLFKLELFEYKKFFLKNGGKEINLENVLYQKKFFFGNLQSNTLNKILNITNKYKKKFEYNISKNLCSREHLTINTGFNIKKIIKILNKEFDQNGVNNTVSEYIGIKFKVIGCAIELSTPKSTWWKASKDNLISSDTIYAHIDQSLICPKAICYLSDVEIDNGPTSFYPKLYEELQLNFFQNIFGRIHMNIGINKNSKFYQIYKNEPSRLNESSKKLYNISKIPKNIFFDSHLGWYVKKNSKLEKNFLEKENFMIGKKGLFVVFDGSRLFHRGGCIKQNSRLVLQVTFGEKINIFHKIIRKINKFFN